MPCSALLLAPDAGRKIGYSVSVRTRATGRSRSWCATILGAVKALAHPDGKLRYPSRHQRNDAPPNDRGREYSMKESPELSERT